MTTRSSTQTTPWWRSRAFVQPLLVTVLGMLASVALYVMVNRILNGASDGPCTLGADSCGYIWMGRMAQALLLIPVFLVGLLVTGLAVGRSSPDTGLAGRALVLTIVVPTLGVAVLSSALDATSGNVEAIGLSIVGAAIVDLVLLLPMALGFAVGWRLQPARKPR